jgi:hypothetical protein
VMYCVGSRLWGIAIVHDVLCGLTTMGYNNRDVQYCVGSRLIEYMNRDVLCGLACLHETKS